MNKKSIIYFIFFGLCSLNILQVKEYETGSPNGKLKIKLHVNKGTEYEVWYNNKQLILPSSIGLNLADGRIIGYGNVKGVKRRKINQTIDVPIGKNKILHDAYNAGGNIKKTECLCITAFFK